MTESEHTRGPYNFKSLVAIPYLREWRTSGRHFLSTTELARKSSLAPSTITRVEKGKLASFDSIRRIAKALHISPQELLGPPPAGN
jgi:transcriptional regulator with XRE-family HTH domain